MLPEETITYEDWIGVGTNPTNTTTDTSSPFFNINGGSSGSSNGGSTAGSGTTTTSPFFNINGGTSSGSSGGIFGSLRSLLDKASSLALTAPKTEEKKQEEKKPETPTAAPVAAPVSEPAPTIKPWMWYTGAAVLGLALIGTFIYFRNR